VKLTDDFVFVHMPKTGGTFVGSVIDRLYPSGWRRLRAISFGPKPVGRAAIDHGHLHAPLQEVPESHCYKPVLATIRSPYEHHVSSFEFGEWRKGEANPDFSGYDWPRIRADHPEFPDLTFADYLAVFGRVGYRRGQDDRRDLGWDTVRFAWQFARSDAPTATSPTAQISEVVAHGCDDIRFVHTENLNAELHDALLSFGLPPESVDFVPTAAKVLPTKGGRTADQKWRNYYDDALMKLVREVEAPLFERFPEFEI